MCILFAQVNWSTFVCRKIQIEDIEAYKLFIQNVLKTLIYITCILQLFHNLIYIKINDLLTQSKYKILPFANRNSHVIYQNVTKRSLQYVFRIFMNKYCVFRRNICKNHFFLRVIQQMTSQYDAYFFK